MKTSVENYHHFHGKSTRLGQYDKSLFFVHRFDIFPWHKRHLKVLPMSLEDLLPMSSDHTTRILNLKKPMGVFALPYMLQQAKRTQSGLSRDQVKILRKCLSSSGISDLMKISERTNRTKFRNQVLNPLLKAELVRMTIPDKPTSSLQKYIITEIGRRLLSSDHKTHL